MNNHEAFVKQNLYNNNIGLKFLRLLRFVMCTAGVWLIDIALIYKTYLPEKEIDIPLPTKAVYIIAFLLWIILITPARKKERLIRYISRAYYILQSIPNFVFLELIFQDLAMDYEILWFTDSTRRLILSVVGTLVILLIFFYGEKIDDKYTAQ